MTDQRGARVCDLYPRRRDADGNLLCAVCRKPGAEWQFPPKGRSNSKYCSAECRTEAYIRCDPNFARQAVLSRDKGVCCRCGTDTEKLQRIMVAARGVDPWGHLYEPDEDPVGPKPKPLDGAEARHILWAIGFTRRHLWEMDHIQPVVHGGGLCGLDNLRTLCTRCHDKETARLAAERAEARRMVQAPPGPLFTPEQARKPDKPLFPQGRRP